MADIGGSYVYHDNFYVRFIMYKIIQPSKVMIENSAFYLGDKIFTELLGPAIDKHLNNCVF
jgi:hypothetical protein